MTFIQVISRTAVAFLAGIAVLYIPSVILDLIDRVLYVLAVSLDVDGTTAIFFMHVSAGAAAVACYWLVRLVSLRIAHSRKH